MLIGIRNEAFDSETRVAVTPDGVTKLLKLGFSVIIESGAGVASSFTDTQYQQAGATVVSRDEVYSQADVLFGINPPTLEEVAKVKPATTLVSFVRPAQNEQLVQACLDKNLTLLAVDMVPRISRAQSMDAMSSLANIAGYRAVVEAAAQFGRFLNGQITAAGKIQPAKVLVVGAGVAGLAAIGTAKNLGAVVRAFDARPETKDQVESMGGKFLSIDFEEKQTSSDGYTHKTSDEFNAKSAELYAKQAKEVDIIITTAAIPGKKAPIIITKEMVDSMKPGSVVVDLAAATGGNCEYTVADQVVLTDNKVKVVGWTNYQSFLGQQASELYSNNLVNLSKLLTPAKDGNFVFNQEDVIIRNMLVTLSQADSATATMLFPPPPISVSAAQPQAQQQATPAETKPVAQPASPVKRAVYAAIGALVYFKLTSGLPVEFMNNLNIFVVASILGYYLIWNVHSALHTPLMSLTNALSGIVIVGAMYQISDGQGLSHLLALIAVFIAALNVFGGFAVTHRMLSMFLKKDKKDQGGK